MTTIEQAGQDWLNEISDCNTTEVEIFTAGVQFAQQWYSVEEECLPKDKPFFSKSSNIDELISLCCWNKSLNKFNPISNGIHQSNLTILNITHWRPIELSLE